MKEGRGITVALIAVLLAIFGAKALSAQDKYTVKVPDGLAFSEFRGFEDWKVIAVSHAESLNLIEAEFDYDTASDTFKPFERGSNCGYACHTIVKAKDYVFTSYGKR